MLVSFRAVCVKAKEVKGFGHSAALVPVKNEENKALFATYDGKVNVSITKSALGFVEGGEYTVQISG